MGCEHNTETESKRRNLIYLRVWALLGLTHIVDGPTPTSTQVTLMRLINLKKANDAKLGWYGIGRWIWEEMEKWSKGIMIKMDWLNLF